MNFDIRLVTANELQDFTKKLHELVLSTIELPNEALYKYNEIWNEQTLKSSLNDLVLIVAKVDDHIIGVLLGTRAEAGVGTIIWVLVDKQIQKGGIGSKMLKLAFNEYLKRGAHKVKLTVPSKDTVHFYEKNDMLVEGYFQNHWYNCDFWQMGRILK